MAQSKGSIKFEHKGIGELLSQDRLVVPINQRSYAWLDTHVQDLLQDLAGAIDSDVPDYFLGTIVLTQTENTLPEVADGQQRLATISILLAAIRDYLIANKHDLRAQNIEQNYLLTTDLRTEDIIPRLSLNVDDNDFFRQFVLSKPGSEERMAAEKKVSEGELAPSNKKMLAATEIVRRHIADIVKPYKDQDAVQRLVDWVNFIRTGAKIISVTVPDHINAFTMFETLNDRGMRAAQSDILKNYLFGRAQERIKEVQQRWAAMIGALETVDDDLTVTYVRHYWVTQHGPTKERELSKEIKEFVSGKQKAVDVAGELATSANDYVALLNSAHPKWNVYGGGTRKHVDIITRQLQVAQIRPLMFAVARYFDIKEGQKAFKLLVSLSVRFLIVGGRGGLLDRHYSMRAHDVGTGKIKAAKELAKAMTDIVPTDAEFEAAFAIARVSHTYLARYYLRALELQVKQDPEPEQVPNEEEEIINLEHVLPENPSSAWKIDADTAAAAYKRIWNMVLLRAKTNVAIGNRSFKDKKLSYKQSGFILTQEVAGPMWGLQEIADRQKRLAELAVKTWPITVK
jgi:hypothetical protein